MERLTAIVLDLDGTLVDSAPELAAAVNGVLAGLGRPALGLNAVRAMIGDGIAALAERALAATGGVPEGAALRAALAEVRRLYDLTPPSPPYPGVIDTLTRLRAARYCIGVCTNKPAASAVRLIDAVGLGPLVDALAGGDSFAVKKPDPGHVTGLLERMDARAEAAVMVGDSANDARAARGAGLAFIAVSYGYAKGPVAALGADIVVDRFGDVESAVERLQSARR